MLFCLPACRGNIKFRPVKRLAGWLFWRLRIRFRLVQRYPEGFSDVGQLVFIGVANNIPCGDQTLQTVQQDGTGTMQSFRHNGIWKFMIVLYDIQNKIIKIGQISVLSCFFLQKERPYA